MINAIGFYSGQISSGGDGGSGFNTEYQTLLDRGTTLVYTLPSAPQQTLQNSLVTSIKSASVWDDIDVMYMFANDAGLNYSTLNWITPASYQCTAVNSPTWTSNVGVAGNGSTSYLNTTWATNGAVKATASSVSFLIVLDNWTEVGSGIEFGHGGATLGFSLHYRGFWLMDGATSFDPEAPTNGTWSANRNGTDVNCYKNNSLVKNATLATGSATSYPLYIGGVNNDPALDQPINTTVRCLIIGRSLDSTKRTALYNAVTTYLAAI